MDSFHQPEYGLRSQFTVKATAKKSAKSMVGKSIGSDQRIAPTVPPVARSERARIARESPEWPRHSRLNSLRPCQHRPPCPNRSGGRPEPGTPGAAGSALGLQRLDERRQHLVHVADDAEVGDREDRGLLVLVDGDDVLGALHPHQVLGGARN